MGTVRFGQRQMLQQADTATVSWKPFARQWKERVSSSCSWPGAGRQPAVPLFKDLWVIGDRQTACRLEMIKWSA